MLGGVFSAGGEGVDSFIGILIFEKGQPGEQGEENQYAGKDQGFRTQVRVYSKADEQQPDDEGDDQADNNARHPCGKIGAQHVHGRRISASAHQKNCR